MIELTNVLWAISGSYWPHYLFHSFQCFGCIHHGPIKQSDVQITRNEPISVKPLTRWGVHVRCSSHILCTNWFWTTWCWSPSILPSLTLLVRIRIIKIYFFLIFSQLFLFVIPSFPFIEIKHPYHVSHLVTSIESSIKKDIQPEAHLLECSILFHGLKE